MFLVVELVVGGMQQLVLVGGKGVGGGHYLVPGRLSAFSLWLMKMDTSCLKVLPAHNVKPDGRALRLVNPDKLS